MATKSNADVKASAPKILDPKDPAMEPSIEEKEEGVIGDSYPTAEALDAERVANEKIAADKAAEDATKDAELKPKDEPKADPKQEVRSALDVNQSSVVHPGAIEKK